MKKFIKIFSVFAMFMFLMVSFGTAMAKNAKIKVIGKPVNGKPYVWLMDEDDMSSSSPYGVPTQQSVDMHTKETVSIGADEADVVLIDSVDDLSTWSGAASGCSYVQAEARKIYIIDPIAIVSTGTAPTSGVSTVTWSGVTVHAPLATSTNNYETFTVVWGRASSGTSASPIPFTVQVWPAPLAGTTIFRSTGAITGSQNLVGMATAGSSTFAIGVVGSYNIDAIGDTMTWRLFNDSAVSAQPVNRYMP